jgi:phospholipid/cholesterol/gamma-HCH transport system substrate-binding protein
MPTSTSRKALAVGLLVAIGFGAVLIAFTFVRRGGYSEKESYVVFAHFNDATGLSWKARVQMAGIPIGEVSRITLAGGRARLELRIRNEIELRQDACVSKRFPSTLLPDAVLEAASGSPQKALLRELPPEQREITCVREGVTVEVVLESVGRIAKDMEVVSGELAKTVAGSQGSMQEIIGNLARLSRELAITVDDGQARIDAILENTEAFTGALREVAQGDQQRYRNIARNVDDATSRIVTILDQVQGILGEGEPELKQSVADVRQSLDKLNRSLDEVQKVAVRIGEGKGVAGKLLADERLGERVGTSIEGVTDYLDRLVKLKIEVGLRSEWLLQENGSKTYAGIRLLPRPDKFYLIELVDDPRGVDTVTAESVRSIVNGVPQDTTTTRTVNEKSLKFTAVIGKRYGPVTLRVGLIESSGGSGADLHLLNDRLQLSTSLYQFDRPAGVKYPNLKIWANYQFLRYLYATIGTDDILNRNASGRLPGGRNFDFGRDVFVGGGLVFTDDDLKTLFGMGAGSIGGAAAN